jgi:hypothetical protein
MEGLHQLFMIPIVEGMRLRALVQFFQALSHFMPARFTRITMFTVWVVDSQDGQHAAGAASSSQPTSQDSGIRLRMVLCPQLAETSFGEVTRTKKRMSASWR